MGSATRGRLRKLEKSQSLRDRAYKSIKHNILNNLSGGDPLVVEDLAGQLGISRTPVREALLALQIEGLVCTVANRGTFVAMPAAEEVRAIYQVREALESLAAKLATPHIPEEELAAMDARFDAIEAAMQVGDYGPCYESDGDFHGMIVRHSGNEVLVSYVENLDDRVFHMRAAARKRSTENLRLAHQEHREVLTALTARDEARAEQTMRDHLHQAANRAETILEPEEDSA